MARRYYRLSYRLDGRDSSLIWYSNDADGVVVANDGSIPSFPDQPSLSAFAEGSGLALVAEESSLIDLDAIDHWLHGPDRDAIDCALFLNAWNLFADVASSREKAFGGSSPGATGVYDKLFWGNNLPAVTPPGEHYIPAWSDDDVAELRRILSEGMMVFRDAIGATNASPIIRD